MLSFSVRRNTPLQHPKRRQRGLSGLVKWQVAGAALHCQGGRIGGRDASLAVMRQLSGAESKKKGGGQIKKGANYCTF